MIRKAPTEPLRRLQILAVISAVAAVAIVSRLWFLQIISAPLHQEVSEENRIRTIIAEAPRGRILDSNNEILAGNRDSFVLRLDWTSLVSQPAQDRALIFSEVSEELNWAGYKVKPKDLQADFDRARQAALEPVTIADDISPETWVALEERSFPGFLVERQQVRTYPFGQLASHALGFVGEVTDDGRASELNAQFAGKDYIAGHQTGRAGLEMLFENELRGTPERRLVEVDSENRIVRTVKILQAAKPGKDLYLTIDAELQIEVERILEEELLEARTRKNCPTCEQFEARGGSLMVADPNDGSVLAMASYPSFDPSDFVFGLTQSQADYLFANDDEPFLNRLIGGLYPAASTFKPVTAYAALSSGVRTAADIWTDEGLYRLKGCRSAGAGCVFRNARSLRHGPIDLSQALTKSSDTYFYSLGEKFWVGRDRYGEELVQDTAEGFGFGQTSGISLPEERSGVVPGPAQRRSRHKVNPEAFPEDRWFTGDSVNLAIGQGELLVTPIQISNLYSMLANGGTFYNPQLVSKIARKGDAAATATTEAEEITGFDVDPDHLEPIRAGLAEVPVSGTAVAAFAGFPLEEFPIAGKTGTAEVRGKSDYSLFAGYGPTDSPSYVVTAVLEEAGFGGAAAGPAVRRTFDFLAGNTESLTSEDAR